MYEKSPYRSMSLLIDAHLSIKDDSLEFYDMGHQKVTGLVSRIKSSNCSC